MIASVVMSLAAALAQASPAAPPPPDQPGQPQIVMRAEALAHLDVPDEIAPAVLPYMGCLMARDGAEVRGRLDPRPLGTGPGTDCGPHRETAQQRADTLLRRMGGRSADERSAYIERTLVSMEAFIGASRARAAARGHDDHAD
jgi:hypothetical protein